MYPNNNNQYGRRSNGGYDNPHRRRPPSDPEKRPSFEVDTYTVLKLEPNLALELGRFILSGSPENKALYALAKTLLATEETPRYQQNFGRPRRMPNSRHPGPNRFDEGDEEFEDDDEEFDDDEDYDDDEEFDDEESDEADLSRRNQVSPVNPQNAPAQVETANWTKPSNPPSKRPVQADNSEFGAGIV